MPTTQITESPVDSPRPTAPSTPLLLIMAAAVAFTAANLYYYQPLLPALRDGLALSDNLLSLVPFATQVGYAVAILFISPLGDIIPRRTLIAALSLLLTCALAMQASAGCALLLIAGTFLMGLGANITQQLIPLAASLSSPQQRGRVLGTLMSGLTLGILLSRVFSGSIAEHLGWRAVYWAAAAAALGWGLLLWRVLPSESTRTTTMRYPALITSMLTLFRQHALLRVSAMTGALWFAAFNAVWASLSLHLTSAPLNLDLQQAGLFGFAGMAGIIGAKASGRWVTSLGTWRTICLALMVLLAGTAVLWSFQYSLAGLVLGIVLIDLGVFAAQVPNQVRVFAIAPSAQSRLNAVYMLFYYLGASAGAIAGVHLMTTYGWQGIMALTAGLCTGAIFLHVAMRNTDPSVKPTST
ncbi:MFS transporter [Gilvimarinus sp. 1_MG-2023]|uniref:MFS transporter n=1 Tax=Gilvimarinus sp. 1_MG-2023 TaxID=3062638 RepID=UPI0026E1B67C|nr:MFS transporter [Gilvimarinus sp. 1_MG-2023]MDO6746386.1 MFS transporter [Gilvimarinus sp. 1_MG-2023]